MAWLDTQFWAGAGASAIATVGAAFTRGRSRFARLEREVEKCQQERAQVIVLKAGFRLMVGAMQRREPHAPELKMCHDLLTKHLPFTPEDTNLACFADVLEALDQIPDPEETP